MLLITESPSEKDTLAETWKNNYKALRQQNPSQNIGGSPFPPPPVPPLSERRKEILVAQSQLARGKFREHLEFIEVLRFNILSPR